MKDTKTGTRAMSGSVSTVYMCFGSIRGESEVPAKVSKAPASGGWMHLTSCSLTATSSYGLQFGNPLEGGSEVTPVQITKVTDASSTGLFREALLGKADKPAVITFLRTGTDGAQEYMRIELENCGIVDFAIDSGGDERATEKFSINYGRMTVISWGYDARGQAAGRASVMLQNVG